MKLVIQIPCWNEAKNIAETIRSLPEKIEGIDTIEVIIIDDGSTDNTANIALQEGVTDVIRLPRHMGLASAFSAGIDTAIKRGADILVNTDADLQYPSDQIHELIKPVIAGDADIAIGDRLSHVPRPFPPVKMFLERLGSLVVRFFSGVPAKDAASGFRAFGKDALQSIIIHDTFSYTLETLLLAGMNNFRIVNITIPSNKSKRKSRLFNSVSQYIFRSWITITRIYLMYHPFKFFVTIGLASIIASLGIGFRFLYFYIAGSGEGHIQSLILLAVLAGVGFQCIILGFVADVVSANRRLLEKLRLRQLKEKYE